MNRTGFSPSIKFDNLFESVVYFMKQNNLTEFCGYRLTDLENSSKQQIKERKAFVEAQQAFLAHKDSFHKKQSDRYREFSTLLKVLKARYKEDPNFQSIMSSFTQKYKKRD